MHFDAMIHDSYIRKSLALDETRSRLLRQSCIVQESESLRNFVSRCFVTTLSNKDRKIFKPQTCLVPSSFFLKSSLLQSGQLGLTWGKLLHLDEKVILPKSNFSSLEYSLLLWWERTDRHRFTAGTTRQQPSPPSKELCCLPKSADFHIHVFF